MPRNDQDTLKEFNDAYSQANNFWSGYISEADKCLEFDLGKQWKATDENYLKSQRREVLKFNKVRRINNLISGYQRKNRLALKVDPIEGSDTRTADDLSEVMIWLMQYSNTYNVMSDAFRQGALVTGINLVELYVDYTKDPASGDLRTKRMPHNRFLIDPAFSELDLSDCGFVVMRDWLSAEQAKAILPKSRKKEVALLKAKGPDSKFANTMPYRNLKDSGLLRYDRFYKQTYRDFTKLIDMQSGQEIEWTGTKERLREILNLFPNLKTYEGTKRTVDLAIILENIVMYNGPEPTEIDDYPFVPIVGFYTPEYHLDAKYKLQGLTKDLMDPQTQENKSKSQMIDIIESQITTGWKAKDGAVINRDALYGSGQGNVVWFNKDSELSDAEQLQARDIPAGMFQLAQQIGEDILDVAGVNLEMFGQTDGGDTQTSGILSKLRTGAGLVVTQVLFDNYRLSKKILGNKSIKIVQKNFSPQKIKRIIGKDPSQEFYTGDFGKYDCVAVEGVLTDSQKQMNYLELKQAKAEGAPIPWSAIFEASNIQNKDELVKFMQQEEQAVAKQRQLQDKVAMLQYALIQSEIEVNKSDTAQNKAGMLDKLGEAETSKTQKLLDLVKALKELQGISQDQDLSLIERLQQLQLNDRTPIQ